MAFLECPICDRFHAEKGDLCVKCSSWLAGIAYHLGTLEHPIGVSRDNVRGLHEEMFRAIAEIPPPPNCRCVALPTCPGCGGALGIYHACPDVES